MKKNQLKDIRNYYDLDGESDVIPDPAKVKKGDLFKDAMNPPPPPPQVGGLTPGGMGNLATAGGTKTIASQIGNPFGKTQSAGHGVGTLFKDGWVVQGKGAGNKASPVGNHAPAKAPKAAAPKTSARIVGAKIPGTPSISGVAKGDLFRSNLILTEKKKK
jgi:hypothetical protein